MWQREEKTTRRAPRVLTERLGKKLIRRINFSFEIVRHQNNGENDSRNHVTDDDLQKRHRVCAKGHGRNANECQRAGFRRNDREADSPPRNIFAAEEIILCVLLVFAEPKAEDNHSQQINDDDGPIDRVKIIHEMRVTLVNCTLDIG